MYSTFCSSLVVTAKQRGVTTWWLSRHLYLMAPNINKRIASVAPIARRCLPPAQRCDWCKQAIGDLPSFLSACDAVCEFLSCPIGSLALLVASWISDAVPKPPQTLACQRGFLLCRSVSCMYYSNSCLLVLVSPTNVTIIVIIADLPTGNIELLLLLLLWLIVCTTVTVVINLLVLLLLLSFTLTFTRSRAPCNWPSSQL